MTWANGIFSGVHFQDYHAKWHDYYLHGAWQYPFDTLTHGKAAEMKSKCVSGFLAMTYFVFSSTSLVIFRGLECDTDFDVHCLGAECLLLQQHCVRWL